MLKLTRWILIWLRGGSLKLLVIATIILIVWGITAPVGTLVWWLGQSAETLGLKQKNRLESARSNSGNIETPTNRRIPNSGVLNCYIIFLPGVGDFSADELTPGEEFFLKTLVDVHPECVAVGDIFPYSAANKSLGGQRLFAPVWRFFEGAKGKIISGDLLIKIRNLWRFAISLDYRYGQVYNQGIATAIIERMEAKHPISLSPNQPIKIILIGTSGGAQVALGATPYLKEWLNAEISVVSVGGVFSGKVGFNAADRVYHLHGSRDPIDDIGGVVFPSRWQWLVNSGFNQARQQGRYAEIISGPHKHDGNQGYFGEDRAENGLTYVDLILQKVNKLPIWSDRKSP
ncbi:hypothetical protein PN499_14990 [Kamptonema animale CS-326]|jgi:hypothetical protein|uniref:hypothetical protein n=1 Tax=Kamptonema animale TaxID=92934 RepID=UPI00232DD72B|nr:hypothetical protein [Kamptonema animale]MDB9512496.1 hypothetical protein [Kamptonema animale CS-326]